jgi:hypothetical protein
MTEDQQRGLVVREARKWLKTPWRHMAAIKGAGVDCAMLLTEVYAAAGLIEWFDPRPYPTDWMLHRDDERFLGFLLARSHQVEKPEVGNVAVLRVGRAFAHGAIITGVKPLTILHAFRPLGCVIEEDAARNRQLDLSAVLYASFWQG